MYFSKYSSDELFPKTKVVEFGVVKNFRVYGFSSLNKKFEFWFE
jgi:hypothetical protein